MWDSVTQFNERPQENLNIEVCYSQVLEEVHSKPLRAHWEVKTGLGRGTGGTWAHDFIRVWARIALALLGSCCSGQLKPRRAWFWKVFWGFYISSAQRKGLWRCGDYFSEGLLGNCIRNIHFLGTPGLLSRACPCMRGQCPFKDSVDHVCPNTLLGNWWIKL